MCSREGRYPCRPSDPSLAILYPLYTANQALRSNLAPSLSRLQDLVSTVHTCTRFSPTTEAACLEALTLIRSAIAAINIYEAFHAPLFDARDPIVLLRQAGVIFEGDENPEGCVEEEEVKVRHKVYVMKGLVRCEEERLMDFEEEFAKCLGRIKRRERVERRLDEVRLARAQTARRMDTDDIEAALLRAELRLRMERESEDEDEDEGEDEEVD